MDYSLQTIQYVQKYAVQVEPISTGSCEHAGLTHAFAVHYASGAKPSVQASFKRCALQTPCSRAPYSLPRGRCKLGAPKNETVAAGPPQPGGCASSGTSGQLGSGAAQRSVQHDGSAVRWLAALSIGGGHVHAPWPAGGVALPCSAPVYA